MSPDDAATAVLRSVVEVTNRVDSIAEWLRGVPDVQTVRRSCWMNPEDLGEGGVVMVGQGKGYRIEWFAEADFADGNGLSYMLDLAFQDDEWVIEASARSHTSQEEAVLLELPTRYATDVGDLMHELVAQADLLFKRREYAVSHRSERME